MLKRALILALSALALAATPAAAEEPASAGPLDLTRRIVRGVDTPGQAVAGYLRIRNGSPVADQLIRVDCACAERIEFHQMRRGPEGARMDTDPTWEIPGHDLLDIRPGSDLHLMLLAFDPAQATDGHVRLTLTFREAGEVIADFALVGDSRAAWETFQ
jgi:copper(I)-binding protein